MPNPTSIRPKRTSARTIQGALEAVKAKEIRLEWPSLVPVSPDPEKQAKRQEIFDVILANRAASDWTKMDLLTAARAAAHLADLIEGESLLSRSGMLVKGGKHNNQYVRSPLLDALLSRAALLKDTMRPLGLTVAQIDPRTVANGRVLAEQVRGPAFHDDLLA